MSNDKDKIREMVMALARGDQDAARSAASEAISAKTKRFSESVTDAEDDLDKDEVEDTDKDEKDEEECDDKEEVEEGGPQNQARRHMRAGVRNRAAKQKATQMREEDETQSGKSDSVNDKADHDVHTGDKPDVLKDKGKSAGKGGKTYDQEAK